jgi:hypothetical protein
MENPKPLAVEGVFIIQENIPTPDLIKEAGIETNEIECITVDKNGQTNVKGVFAVGDCTCGGMQVVTATGQGANAGLSAYRFIKSISQRYYTGIMPILLVLIKNHNRVNSLLTGNYLNIWCACAHLKHTTKQAQRLFN